MSNYFIDCLKALKNFTGLKVLFAFTVLAWFYLFFREKNKTLRAIFVTVPFVVIVVFICPLTMWLFEKVGLDTDTYYRMLWIIPMGMITVYAAVRLCQRTLWTRVAGLIAGALVIALSGVYVYSSPIFFETENMYGLPQQTIDVVDYIRSIDEHDIITVCPSANLITTIRQYDSLIRMPYGRDMFNPSLNYYHPVYEVFEQTPKLNFKNLLKVSRDFEVEYFIVHATRLLDDDPVEAGLEYVGTVQDHNIYKDPVIAEQIALLDEFY